MSFATPFNAAIERHALAAAAADLLAQRRVIGAALATSERDHAARMPKLERASADTLARLRKAEAEVEAARGPAVAAEQALASEKGRAARAREDHRAQLFERSHPRLGHLYRIAARALGSFRFAEPAPAPMVKGRDPSGRVVLVVRPGYVRPEPAAETRAALEALRAAMEQPEQDVAAIEAAFFSALPAQFATEVRNLAGQG